MNGAIQYCFIEPLDVLVLRGNKLFGDPGSFGESLMPPWPSVAAGAIRSRMLADAGIDLAEFASGNQRHSELGTPREPGPFRITAFHVARRRDGVDEILIAPPADLVIQSSGHEEPIVSALAPTSLPQGNGLGCSSPLPLLPVLAERERSKPASGYWLNENGWNKYLAGEIPDADDLVKTSELWSIEQRVGVGLDAATRRAEDGRLFSLQAVAMKPGAGVGVGFVAGISGADAPKDGLLRFGGDGRAAAIRAANFTPPEPDYEKIVRDRKCRMVLTTPGIFGTPSDRSTSQPGWLPTGARTENGAIIFDLHGVRGRIVCAAVPRAEVVSGWDLAKGEPKPALRAAPAGSVWWLDDLETTPEALSKLVNQGLWSESYEDAIRRAEGFNRVHAASWMKSTKEKVNE